MGEAETFNEEKSKYKRKRKKTFLVNARKYAKKGCYGRGSHLEADIYDYLVRIMEVYNAGFPSEEEKTIFVSNVFEQIENQEISCSCNQVGCRIIETLLPFASDEILEKFMTCFGTELRPLCSDKYASHVLEALVQIFSKKSLDDSTDEEFKVKCKEYTLKISKFLLNNLEDYVWDPYGNHIIRIVLESLAQIPKEDTKNNYKKTDEVEIKIEIPEDYQLIVNEYAERLSIWPQFKDLPYEILPSCLLQVLIKALAKTNKKLLRTCIKKLIDESFIGENKEKIEESKSKQLSQVFMSKPAMMLLESIIQVAKSKSFTQLYSMLFANNLVQLSTMRSTNFAVQKLITCSQEKTEFEAIFEELQGSFKDILKMGHSGVVLAIAQTCKRLTTKQGSFIQNLMNDLNCNDSQEKQNLFVLAVLKMSASDQIEMTNAEKITLHGSLLVQVLLEFNKPIKIINSILSMDTNLLKTIFCDRMGSHIVDSYMKSTYVGEKSREKLIRKMQGTYQDLAASKCGSRSFEAIWSVSNLKHKEWIMNELSQKDKVWSTSDCGKIIAGKINLSLYKRNKEEWKNSLNKCEKTKSMFADILTM